METYALMHFVTCCSYYKVQTSLLLLEIQFSILPQTKVFLQLYSYNFCVKILKNANAKQSTYVHY